MVCLVGTIFSLVLSAWLTWRFSDPASHFYILDHPNERSLHVRPVPRSGGLAILAGITAGLMLAWWNYSHNEILPWLSLSMLLLATVSYIDDRYYVRVVYRLLIQFTATFLLLWGGFSIFPALSLLLLSCFIVWMINLYNFMDGMDGFAGGMAVIGFGAFALLGWQAENPLFMLMSMITASAAGGFLIFNLPPARIFMGDVGSSTLGLMAGALSLWGARDGVFPFWIALLVFSPFIMDATVTLMRRLWRREKVWQAHRKHYYQRLVQAGWGHRKTVIVEYVIMLGCGITALLSVHATVTAQMAVLAGWVIFYFIFFLWVSWHTSGRLHNSA